MPNGVSFAERWVLCLPILVFRQVNDRYGHRRSTLRAVRSPSLKVTLSPLADVIAEL
jgi:hypothetical protein